MDKDLALIIEDDERLADIFAEALRSVKFHPEILADGETALERIKEVVPGLILLDMHLPEVSGEVLIQAIRADDRLAETVVFLTTADAVLADTWRHEADLVLLKPISFNQLRDLAGRLRPNP